MDTVRTTSEIDSQNLGLDVAVEMSSNLFKHLCDELATFECHLFTCMSQLTTNVPTH